MPGDADADSDPDDPWPGDQHNDAPPPEPQLQIAGAVFARIAARYTVLVPGVASLQPDLPQYVTGLATRVLNLRQPAAIQPSPDGVDVDLDTAASTARIAVSVVTRLGYNCTTVAETIQQHVAQQVQSHTGFTAHVTVTVADIDLPTDTAAPGASQ